MTATDTLRELTAFLESDPDNLALLADTARAALDAGDATLTAALIQRYAALADLPIDLAHLDGLAQMHLQHWDEAATRFDALLAQEIDSPAIRFNLAWSHAMARRYDAAQAILDDATAEALPAAAQLQVGLLHQLGDIEGAMARATVLRDRFPDHRGLNAVIATLAIDAEDAALAREAAERAGDHPDALITLATLALGDEDLAQAELLFGQALERNPSAPRALVGQGLVALARQDPAAAAQSIDKGAKIFGNHPGSWLAAGWAHILAGDIAAGRDRFEQALAVDDRFGEAQGSLAVVELMEGKVAEAQHRARVAMRLDKDGFGAALAMLMLKAGEHDHAGAQEILTRALSTAVGPNGKTLGDMLARIAANGATIH